MQRSLPCWLTTEALCGGSQEVLENCGNSSFRELHAVCEIMQGAFLG